MIATITLLTTILYNGVIITHHYFGVFGRPGTYSMRECKRDLFNLHRVPVPDGQKIWLSCRNITISREGDAD